MAQRFLGPLSIFLILSSIFSFASILAIPREPQASKTALFAVRQNLPPALAAKFSPRLDRVFEAARTNAGAQDARAGVILLLNQQWSETVSGAPRDTGKRLTAQQLRQRRQKIYRELTTMARRTQAPLLRDLKERGFRVQSFFLPNAIAVEDVRASDLALFARWPRVAKIVGNPRVPGVSDPVSTGTVGAPRLDAASGALPLAPYAAPTPAPNVVRTGADQVWSQFRVRGEGITIAGQDSGYDWSHPTLQPSYRGYNGSWFTHRYQWHDAIHAQIARVKNSCGYDLTEPCDDTGHGTHTMGSMVGDDGWANAIGMAPDARWIGCRNMDQGVGRPSTYLECFEWFLAPYAPGEDKFRDGRPDFAPHVINNSWGCPDTEGCDGSEFLPVLKTLEAAGIFVVVSAGNEGSGCWSMLSAPSFYLDDAFSIGAMNHRNGNVTSFSSRGPTQRFKGIGPHVVAPGEEVRSSVPGGRYDSKSGTSMAGPHVAGLVALIWSAQPKLIGQVKETRQLIQRTARPVRVTQTCDGLSGQNVPNYTAGYGEIDALAAVTEARKL